MRNCPSIAAGLSGYESKTQTPGLALKWQGGNETVIGSKTRREGTTAEAWTPLEDVHCAK